MEVSRRNSMVFRQPPAMATSIRGSSSRPGSCDHPDAKHHAQIQHHQAHRGPESLGSSSAPVPAGAKPPIPTGSPVKDF